MLSSKEELYLLFLRAMDCCWPGISSFLSSTQRPPLTQDSQVQICLFLPAVWFSAFIIRTTKYFMHFLPTPLFSACFFSIYWRFPYSICVIQQILYFMWYLFLFFELRALPQIIYFSIVPEAVISDNFFKIEIIMENKICDFKFCFMLPIALWKMFNQFMLSMTLNESNHYLLSLSTVDIIHLFIFSFR